MEHRCVAHFSGRKKIDIIKNRISAVLRIFANKTACDVSYQ
jgi:hypothetical protein